VGKDLFELRAVVAGRLEGGLDPGVGDGDRLLGGGGDREEEQ